MSVNAKSMKPALLILILLIGISFSGCRIFHHSKADKAIREQENKQQGKEKELDKLYERDKAHLYKIQSKTTKQRMKESKRQADKLNRKMRKASGKKGCR
jgi:hypothetical protein